MINFLRKKTLNYNQVEKQIFSSINKHLPEGSFQTSYEYNSSITNFTLFIDCTAEIFMSHGAADKNYHERPLETDETIYINNQRNRTHLLVPGEWMKAKILKAGLLQFDADHICAVGWPRLDLLLKKQKQYRLDNPEPTKKVLWAPTHDFARRGDDLVSLSSYPAFEAFVPALSSRYDFSMSLHPRNRETKKPTMDELIAADIVISDFGTMVYEAIALGKTVIFPSWINRSHIFDHIPGSAEQHIYEQQFGNHAGSFDELMDMIENPPALTPQSKSFFDSYLSPSTYGKSGKLIANLLKKIDAEKGGAQITSDALPNILPQ